MMRVLVRHSGEVQMPGNGKVFISHAHADNDRCRPLAHALAQWGVDYWFDAERMKAGQALSHPIQRAIAERDVFIRVCSRAAAESYWVELETGAFRALVADAYRHGSRDRRVLINLIVDPGYQREPFDMAALYIDATGRPEREWLGELAQALGISAWNNDANSGGTDTSSQIAPAPLHHTTGSSPSSDGLDNSSPILRPASELVLAKSGYQVFVDFNAAEHEIALINERDGIAFNIRAVLFGPKPDNPYQGATGNFYLWSGATLGNGAVVQEKMKVGGVMLRGDDTIDDDPTHTLYAPSAPTAGDMVFSAAPYFVARLTITYHDVMGATHASIYDYTDQHQWRARAFPRDLPKDLEELNREATERRIPRFLAGT